MDIIKKKTVANVIIIALSLFLLYTLIPYKSAFLGALVLFVLVKPPFTWLSKKIDKRISALIVILLSLVIVIVPSFFVVNLLIKEISSFSLTPLKGLLNTLHGRYGTYINIEPVIDDINKSIIHWAKSAIPGLIHSISGVIIQLFLMYAILYFLLLNWKKIKKQTIELIPFNHENSLKLMHEFSNVTYSTVFGMGVIALVQGTLVAIGFLIFKIQGAVLWGSIAAIASFLPVIGPSIVWLPAALIQLMIGNYKTGIGLLAYGTFIVSLADNIIRPIVVKKMADIHPLITILGVFIGLPTFGLLGIIIGPLLLQYFFLLIKMYKEEYL